MTTVDRISIVVPVHNEASNIEPLLSTITSVMEELDVAFEVIIVDDGSTDATYGTVCELLPSFETLRVIRLSRNFGHQSALLAGMRQAKGDAVVTMDGDLEHPPELIPKLIDKWRGGIDVVHTVRDDTDANNGLFKTLTSRWFYKFLRWNSNVPIRAGMADFRLIDRRALEHVITLSESMLFYRGLFLWVGFSQAFVSYVPAQRVHGAPSFTAGRMVAFARDGLLSFSARPLYWALGFGLFMAVGSISYGIYAIAVRFLDDQVIPGWASLAVVTVFLFGILFIFLGLIGAYLAAIYTELKSRPHYIVWEEKGPATPWDNTHDHSAKTTRSK